jgi:hypothetical protein
MRDHTGAGDRWIPETDYRFICSHVPIVCVDLLPVLADSGRFGLIERDTYDGGRGLCLIGGAVLLDEPLHEALERHVRVTLGENVVLQLASLHIVGVYQYFKHKRPGQLHDPRKNAVAITYVGTISGDVRPLGEAHKFETFEQAWPPDASVFGFGQGKVVSDALAAVLRFE